jgi:hypothetical protein
MLADYNFGCGVGGIGRNVVIRFNLVVELATEGLDCLESDLFVSLAVMYIHISSRNGLKITCHMLAKLFPKMRNFLTFLYLRM